MLICALIVTYRNTDDLLRCVSSIRRQSLLPSAIVIVDNDESNGSRNALEEQGYAFNRLTNSAAYVSADALPQILYFYPGYNSGGAGGFFCGLKLAVHIGFQWFWLMDDDGEPTETALSELLIASRDNPGPHVFNSLVVDKAQPHLLASSLNRKKTISALMQSTDSKYLHGDVRAFNGTFFSKAILDSGIWPNPNFFLWGDEIDFCNRALLAGYTLTTVVNSIHKHPTHEWKAVTIFNKFAFPHTDNSTLNYVKARNYSYLRAFKRPGKEVKVLLKATLYYLVQGKGDLRGFSSYILGYLDGKRNNFRRTQFKSSKLEDALIALKETPQGQILQQNLRS